MSKTNSEEPLSTFPKLIFANHLDDSTARNPYLNVETDERACVEGDASVWVAMYELKSVRRLRKEVREV